MTQIINFIRHPMVAFALGYVLAVLQGYAK